jgi:hypothetical protein
VEVEFMRGFGMNRPVGPAFAGSRETAANGGLFIDGVGSL